MSPSEASAGIVSHSERLPESRRPSRGTSRREELERRDLWRAAVSIDATPQVRLDSIEQAISDIAAGKAVIVVGDENRRDEGDIVFAASAATPQLMAWTVRHSGGLVGVAMHTRLLDRLGIAVNDPDTVSAYTVSVNAREGTTLGISAADRAVTARVLADSTADPSALTRPGHVFPMRYRKYGVLVYRSRTEAAVDLMTAAGLAPAGVLTEVINDDGTPKNVVELRTFADEHRLSMVSVNDLVNFRWRSEIFVERVAAARLPTRHGEFKMYGYEVAADSSTHVALVYGDIPGDIDEPMLTRVHFERLTADVFGDQRECFPPLDAALARIAAEGRGIAIYVRDDDTRSTDSIVTLHARALQDDHRNQRGARGCGPQTDPRYPGIAAQILRDLEISDVRLLTARSEAVVAVHEYGVRVAGHTPLTPQTGVPTRGGTEARRE